MILTCWSNCWRWEIYFNRTPRNNMSDLSFDIVVSVGLAILGIVSAVRKRISIGFSRLGSSSAEVALTGNRAVQFGCISVIAGLIPIAMILYTQISSDKKLLEQGIVSFTVGLGIGIVLLTFFIELFLEFLADLQDHNRKK
jgi:hypothetical protein